MNQNKSANKASQVGRQRAGGRSARVKDAVLKGALDELLSVGYTNFSVSSVASRAGVHETTVYRRWPQKEELISDAVLQITEENIIVPDSGSLREDLLRIIQSNADFIESPVGRAIISHSFTSFDASGLEALKRTWAERIDRNQKIFERAAERGEWSIPYDREAVFTEAIGPLMAYVFLLRQPITQRIIEDRVEAILRLRD